MHPNTNHFIYNSLLVGINFIETIHSKSILAKAEPNIHLKVSYITCKVVYVCLDTLT